MSEEQIRKDFSEVFENLNDYALIRVERGGYLIYHITNRAHMISGQDLQPVIDLMLKENVKVADKESEVDRADFVRYMMKWDPEKKAFVKMRWDPEKKEFVPAEE